MEINTINDFTINPYSTVKVTEMGNVTEIMYMEKRNTGQTVKKLDKDNYLVISTGEVIQCNHSENRSVGTGSLRKTFRRLRNLINTNIVNVDNVRWITLTYAENMTDTNRLYDDFKKFNQRMQYWCKKRDISKYEYIVAMEPQGRGAWHCHLLMIWKEKAPYIQNEELRKVWKQGFVTVKALDDVDNVGAYLTAYLGDMEFDDANKNNLIHAGDEIKETKDSKKYVKGARLNLYPTGFNLFRHSTGIEEPKEKYVQYRDIKKASVGALTYTNTVSIQDENYNNTISKEYYNRKR